MARSAAPGETLNELALFAGAGGGLLGTALLGFRTVCAVEKNSYRQAVLLARQRDGLLPRFPIWDDVRTFDGRPFRALVHLVTAGFPCQPYSRAGRQRGRADARNLWPDTLRIIREVQPAFALLENVPDLLRFAYFGQILRDLAKLGFRVRWDVLSARGVGAPHQRRRLWLLAFRCHSTAPRPRSALRAAGRTDAMSHRRKLYVHDARNRSTSYLCLGAKRSRVASHSHCESANGTSERRIWRSQELPADSPRGTSPAARPRGAPWRTKPPLLRVAHGLANRMDRIAALGDGQVPQVVVRAWQALAPEYYMLRA